MGTILSILSLFLCGALFSDRPDPEKECGGNADHGPYPWLWPPCRRGFPAVVTICLALSVTKMVRVHTIVRKLPAVENAGCRERGLLRQDRNADEKTG